MKYPLLALISVAILIGTAVPSPGAGGGPELKSVEPKEGFPDDKVVLYGSNFGAQSSENLVMFNTTPVYVNSACPTSVTVKVPSNAKPGEALFTVTVKGQKSVAMSFKVKVPIPELSGINMQSAPPGTSVTISGKNFSAKASENKVLFGGVESTATAASAGSITVPIPQMNYPQSVSVEVVSNGVKSSNQLQMMISNKEY